MSTDLLVLFVPATCVAVGLMFVVIVRSVCRRVYLPDKLSDWTRWHWLFVVTASAEIILSAAMVAFLIAYAVVMLRELK